MCTKSKCEVNSSLWKRSIPSHINHERFLKIYFFSYNCQTSNVKNTSFRDKLGNIGSLQTWRLIYVKSCCRIWRVSALYWRRDVVLQFTRPRPQRPLWFFCLKIANFIRQVLCCTDKDAYTLRSCTEMGMRPGRD